MKNKSMLVITFSLIIIAMIIGALFVFNVIPPQVSVSGTCTGGQVLSIDSATKTYSNDLQKDVIRVVFSTLPTSECLEIKFDATDMENKLASQGVDFDVQKSNIGDIVLTNSQKLYTLNQLNGIYRKISVQSYVNGILSPLIYCTNNYCADKNPNLNVIDSIAQSPDCKCVYYDDKGKEAYIGSSEKYLWTTRIAIDGVGETTLYSGAGTSDLSNAIGSKVFVKWSGNLQSNDNLGSIDRDAYFNLADNQYRIVEDGLYNYLLDRRNTVVSNLIDCNNVLFNCQNELTDIYGYNSEFDSLTSTSHLQSWVNQESLVDSASISSNKLVVDLGSPIVYPTFTLDIEASEIGIYVSTGVPEVTCPSNINDLISGQTKTATFKIKNIGNNNGAFDFSLDCNKGSQQLSPSPPTSISAGSTKSITATLGLTVENTGTETSNCIFTATELNTEESDSCSFGYTATHQSQCIEGTKTCELGNTQLWTCRADGGYDKANCEFGCYINQQGQPECKSEDIPPIPDGTCGKWLGFIPDPICLIKNFLLQFKIIFSIVVGFLIFVSSWLLYAKIDRKLDLGKIWYVGMIIGLVLGLAIGYLTYVYFFAILIVGILSAIGMFIIGRFI